MLSVESKNNGPQILITTNFETGTFEFENFAEVCEKTSFILHDLQYDSKQVMTEFADFIKCEIGFV